MNKRKLMRYLKDHPEILDNDRVRSLPYLNEKDVPNKPYWLNDDKSKKGFFYMLKPAYIAVAAACIVVLLSFAPPVQAFAKSLYTTVVSWFVKDDEASIIIQHGPEPPMEVPSEEFKNDFSEYSSIDELPDEYKIVYVNNNDYSLNKIIVQATEEDYSGEYYFEDVLVDVSYSYLETSYTSMFSADEGQTIFTTTKDGLEVTGIYYEDQRGTAVAYYDRAQISFNTQAGLSYDDFVEFIKSTEIIY